MSRIRERTAKEGNGLVDLLGLVLLNIAVGAPTGFALWLVLNGIPVTWLGWLGIQFVAWFTGVVVLVGAFTRMTWLVDVYAWLWRAILRMFRAGMEA